MELRLDDNHKLVLLIDALAFGYGPETAAHLCGYTVEDVNRIQSEYAGVITRRASELRSYDIFSPTWRVLKLRDLAKMSEEGYISGDKMVVSPSSAIEALKEVNRMLSATRGDVVSIATTSIAELARELVNELKKDHPTLDNSDLAQVVAETFNITFDEAKRYVN